MKPHWTILSAAAGAIATWLLVDIDEKPVRTVAATEHRTVVVRESAPSIGDDLRRELTAIRDEIDGRTEPLVEEAVDSIEPSPEQLAAEETAREVVRSAIDAGRWTAADSRLFDDVAARLGPDAHAELMQELTLAINRQELKLEAPATF